MAMMPKMTVSMVDAGSLTPDICGWVDAGRALAHLVAEIGVGRADDEERDRDHGEDGVVHGRPPWLAARMESLGFMGATVAPTPAGAQLITRAKALRVY